MSVIKLGVNLHWQTNEFYLLNKKMAVLYTPLKEGVNKFWRTDEFYLLKIKWRFTALPFNSASTIIDAPIEIAILYTPQKCNE